MKIDAEIKQIEQELASIDKMLSMQEQMRQPGISNDMVDAAQAPFRKQRKSLQAQLTRLKGSGAMAQVAVGVGGDSHGPITVGNNNRITHIINQYQKAGGEVADQDKVQKQIIGYLRWMMERFGKIVLRGIELKGKRVVELDLETVYVPLVASLGSTRFIKMNEMLALKKWEVTTDKSGQNQSGFISRKRFIVTGSAGSGKTTVLQHIAWTLATAIYTDNSNFAQEKLGLVGDLPLPIFVSLSAYAQYRQKIDSQPMLGKANDRTLATFVSRYLIESQAGLEFPADFFAKLLANGRAVMLLLDGLDEVPDEDQRVLVRQAIEELVQGRREVIQVIVTCRTVAYKGRSALGLDFIEVQVQPLEEEQITAMVEQAYKDIYRDDPKKRQIKSEELLDGIKNLRTEREQRLGKNTERFVTSPLLVRMLLIVHYNNHRLPEQRVELYQKTVEAILRPDHAPDEEVAQKISKMIGGSYEIHRELVEHLAFTMHNRGATQGREIEEDEIRRALQEFGFEKKRIKAFIWLTRQRGTLLQEQLRVYRFLHLGLQEFLVARYLAETIRSEDAIANFLEQGPILSSWWREPALLVGGYLGLSAPRIGQRFLRRLASVDGQANERSLPPDVQLATVEIAATTSLEWRNPDKALRRALADRIVELFNDEKVMTLSVSSRRIAAGDMLARLGDPRFQANRWHLLNEPLLGFIEIPAGSFVMGSLDNSLKFWADETPCHEVSLPTYWLARYPVTVAQWQAFINLTDYKPDNSSSLKEGLANHPVRYVSWHDAMAYCRWLHQKLTEEALPRLAQKLPDRERDFWEGLYKGRLNVTLPSEAEWEKAARGIDQRTYPWGEHPDPERTNCATIETKTTSPVGAFLHGASPYGCEEMSGNVWEWTRSLDKSYPYPKDPKERAKREDLENKKDFRILRGGSFIFSIDYARCAVRYANSPTDCFKNRGFRVAVSPLSQNNES